MMEKVTEGRINKKIVSNKFYRFPDTTVTVCLITLENGYGVVGQSACVRPEDYDETIGRDVAFEDAKNKIWALEGYLEKEKSRENQ